MASITVYVFNEVNKTWVQVLPDKNVTAIWDIVPLVNGTASIVNGTTLIPTVVSESSLAIIWTPILVIVFLLCMIIGFVFYHRRHSSPISIGLFGRV